MIVFSTAKFAKEIRYLNKFQQTSSHKAHLAVLYVFPVQKISIKWQNVTKESWSKLVIVI